MTKSIYEIGDYILFDDGTIVCVLDKGRYESTELIYMLRRSDGLIFTAHHSIISHVSQGKNLGTLSPLERMLYGF